MITDYEIVDLGVHHPDYFQGFGTSYTRFEHSTYGIGSTAQEAYDDALEQMACGDADFTALVDAMPTLCPFDGEVPADPERGDNDGGGETALYHVGIRWNAVQSEI